ncbi:MFS transporter [Actinoplanes sp. KI2]|uniref:MFS transporter n=1 Tax=Actinoplanes sp. KI2 TaxID=2983315 RepID=UPI0021D5DB15|nr:MFS transporter [Actinoplanes sp. KI2]MCU7726911.1 MFS transporter [Actinoplanes sp. KI2]
MRIAALAPTAGSALGFYLPLAVIPLVAPSASAAGLTTGAFLIATVLCELLTPRIVARLGYRRTVALGLFLLGAPTLVFLRATSAPALIAANAVRGMGFATAVVAGGALIALLVPASRRGAGVALTGLVSGVCSLAALPAGLWAALRYGPDPVFVVTALAPLLTLAALPFLPDPRPAEPAGRIVAISRRLPVVFAACTSAAGVIVTFLPLAIPASTASIVLLVQPAVSTLARWAAGRIGDRRGHSRLLLPGVLLAIGGTAALAGTGSFGSVLLGASAFGAGFGILQNVTLALMYERAPRSAYSGVSAVWNAAYDLGMAAGAIGFGVLVPALGFSAAFLLTAATMLPALVSARRESARPRLGVPDPAAHPAPRSDREPIGPPGAVTMRALPDMG